MAKFRKKNGSPSDVARGTPQMVGDTTSGNVERERIEARAYELYLERGGGDGAAMEDWLAAEREMRTPAGPDDQKA